MPTFDFKLKLTTPIIQDLKTWCVQNSGGECVGNTESGISELKIATKAFINAVLNALPLESVPDLMIGISIEYKQLRAL